MLGAETPEFYRNLHAYSNRTNAMDAQQDRQELGTQFQSINRYAPQQQPQPPSQYLGRKTPTPPDIPIPERKRSMASNFINWFR